MCLHTLLCLGLGCAAASEMCFAALCYPKQLLNCFRLCYSSLFAVLQCYWCVFRASAYSSAPFFAVLPAFMCFSVIGPLVALLPLTPVLPSLLEYDPDLDTTVVFLSCFMVHASHSLMCSAVVSVNEARIVRKVIVEERVERLKPDTLVYVFWLLYYHFYGKFRLISCPQWGLAEDSLPECCCDSTKMRRAVSALTSCGDYLFADFSGISSADANYLYNLDIDEQAWRSGRAGLGSVHDWVKTVQIRALQDIAVEDEHTFVQIWCTKSHEGWGDQGKTWTTALKIREERDIGWLCGESAPGWSTHVWNLREEIRILHRKLYDLIVEEDMACWRRHRSRDAAVAGLIEAPPTANAEEADTSRPGLLEERHGVHVRTALEQDNTGECAVVVVQGLGHSATPSAVAEAVGSIASVTEVSWRRHLLVSRAF